MRTERALLSNIDSQLAEMRIIMAIWQRRRLFVDAEVQGAFLVRATVYWTTCIFTVSLMLFIWQAVRATVANIAPQHNDVWSYVVPVAVSAMLLLPIFAYDLIKLSNMLVGPVLRLRRSMRQLIAGERVPPLKFRTGDFWQSFAGEFNAVAERIDQLELERDEALAALKQAESALKTGEESPTLVG